MSPATATSGTACTVARKCTYGCTYLGRSCPSARFPPRACRACPPGLGSADQGSLVRLAANVFGSAAVLLALLHACCKVYINHYPASFQHSFLSLPDSISLTLFSSAHLLQSIEYHVLSPPFLLYILPAPTSLLRQHALPSTLCYFNSHS